MKTKPVNLSTSTAEGHKQGLLCENAVECGICGAKADRYDWGV